MKFRFEPAFILVLASIMYADPRRNPRTAAIDLERLARIDTVVRQAIEQTVSGALRSRGKYHIVFPQFE